MVLIVHKKPNNKLLYIHSLLNHPPQIIKQLPNFISERLSKKSFNQEICNTLKVEYKDALKKSGCNVDLRYTNNKSEEMRKWSIILFSPPCTKSVSTNVAKTFLQLTTKYFARSYKLHKIFNHNTVKVSYSCMTNMSKIIKEHKKVAPKPRDDQRRKYNGRKKTECPMEGTVKLMTQFINVT